MNDKQNQFEREILQCLPNVKIISLYTGEWNCIKCKCKIDGYEWETIPYRLRKATVGCPVCLNQVVLLGINDMWTTNPELAKLLANPEDGYKYTQCSNKKVDWKCPNCGNIIKDRYINNIKNQGLHCNKCSDGISYPEKIMISVLNQLNVKFNTQLNKSTFVWCTKYKYDFYVPSINCIIETHGIQHYEQSPRGRSLDEEQENDKFKEKLAKENGINNYIVIDARYSDLEYIKNNILNSKLSQVFDLSNINWKLCYEFTLTNLIKYVCCIWNNITHNILEIVKMTNLARNTITNYLKTGSKLDWCNYNSKEQMKLNGRINGSKSHNGIKKVICITTNKIFDSVVIASRYYNISSNSISNCLRKVSKSAGMTDGNIKLVWEYYDNYLKGGEIKINE